MRRSALFLLGIIFISEISSQENTLYSTNEIIVKFKDEADLNLKDAVSRNSFGNKTLDSLNLIHEVDHIKLTGNKKKRNAYILQFNSNQNINELITKYMKSGLFEYVEPNFIGKVGGQKCIVQTTPNDTYYSRQWGLNNNGTFTLSPSRTDADIDMDLAWDVERGSPSVVIAILDTGLKLNHPDISDRLWINSDELKNNTDSDNNGYADDTNGWDFANDDNDPSDDGGHGTNVAGIIGAKANNNLGYAGVDWNARLMICKVINENDFGFYSWWTEAIYYAVDNGARVINMSVGGSSFSNSIQDAVDYAHLNGVIIVASMMNLNNDETYYPAGYQNTIAVGSTNPNDERSAPFFWDSTSGSNYGNHIDVVAPGNYIYGLNYSSNTNYNSYWGGTSQSTPLVTGLCALLLAQDPNRSPDDLRTIIRNTAEDQVGKSSEDVVGFDIYYGYGRINAYEALTFQSTSTSQTNTENESTLIYPNPFSDYIFINTKNNFSSVSLHSIEGAEVFRKEVKSAQEEHKINISHLSLGTYIVVITDKNGNIIHSEKVIKN